MAGKHRWRILLTAFVMITGIVVFWAAIAALIVAIGSSLFQDNNFYQRESLVVAVDGTPLIITQEYYPFHDTTYRTLDNRLVQARTYANLEGASFSAPYRPPGVVDIPLNWQQRLASISDADKPATIWVFVRTREQPGRAYLVGYDYISKQRVGYLSRTGFSTRLPELETWFRWRKGPLNSGDIASPASIGYYGSLPSYYNYSSLDTPPLPETLRLWEVVVRDGDDILVVDLQQQTVRPIASIESMEGLQIAAQPVSVDEDRPAEPENGVAAEETGVHFSRRTVHRVLVRLDDRIEALNPFDGKRVSFPLPESLQEKSLMVYIVENDQLLLEVNRRKVEDEFLVDLLWINPAREIVREETVELASTNQENPLAMVMAAGAICPSLAAALIVLLLVGPFSALQNYQAPSYWAAVSEPLRWAWPLLVILPILSLILAAVVYRWQRKYHRRHSTLWISLLLVTTLPGFLAYLAMHRRPPLAKCEACGSTVPRDRKACANCTEAFAQPPLLGTEIFA